MKKTKDGKVLVTVETTFVPIGMETTDPYIASAMMKLYGQLVDVMNGGLIDEYNSWFSENVFDGDMTKDEKMLELYDAGLSAWCMNAAHKLVPMFEYTEDENRYLLFFTNIDMHRASYTAMDMDAGVGVKMILGKTSLVE